MVGPGLSRANGTQDILDLLTDLSLGAVGARAVAIFMPQEEFGRFELIRQAGLSPTAAARSRSIHDVGPSFLASSLRSGTAIAFDRENAAGAADEDARAFLEEAGTPAALAIPLMAGGRPLALVMLALDAVPPPADVEIIHGQFRPFGPALDRVHDRNQRQAVERAQRLLAAIVSSSDDAIFAKDLSGIIQSWNAGAQRIYGYQPDEIIGRSVSMLVPPEIRNDVPIIMERLRRGERIEHYETVRVARNGTRLAVSLTISPIRDEEGRVIGASTIARNITARRRMEASRRLIAEVGRTLAETLKPDEVLRTLADMLVREFADYCVTYIAENDGRVNRVGVAHHDADDQALVQQLLGLTPPSLFDAHGAGAVIRTGEAVYVPEIPSQMLRDAAGGGEYLRILQALQPRSSIIVPLRARGRTVGAIACTTTYRSGRRYTDEDFATALELADRAGLALDNARLYEESRAEIEHRLHAEAALRRRYEQLRVVYHMTEAVGRAGAIENIHDEALDALRRSVSAERAAILLLDDANVMRFRAWRGISETYRRAVEGHSPWPADVVDPQPIVIPDVELDTGIDPELRAAILAEGIRALSFIPLVFGGSLLGKFMLYFDRPRALDSDEIEMALAIGGSIAFAITRMLDEQNVRAAKQAAENASLAKSQFLGVMSHELRTPLNAVIGYADLLLLQIRGKLSPGQREQVDRIRASARHQLNLIDELLTYTRIEAGREEPRFMATDVRRILSDVAEFVSPEAERKNLHLSVDLPETELEMVSDPAKLRQILLNLAGNATKFTQHGHVTLRARATEDGVVIEVQDTGPGIPEDRLEHIFLPFAQVDEGRTRGAGGTGLGLSIARDLTAMLGGELSVESSVGSGSTFRLRLPRHQAMPRP